jgi:hypothetical protein
MLFLSSLCDYRGNFDHDEDSPPVVHCKMKTCWFIFVRFEGPQRTKRQQRREGNERSVTDCPFWFAQSAPCWNIVVKHVIYKFMLLPCLVSYLSGVKGTKGGKGQKGMKGLKGGQRTEERVSTNEMRLMNNWWIFLLLTQAKRDLKDRRARKVTT